MRKERCYVSANCRTASFVGSAGIAPLPVTVMAPHTFAKYRAFRRRSSFCHKNFNVQVNA